LVEYKCDKSPGISTARKFYLENVPLSFCQIAGALNNSTGSSVVSSIDNPIDLVKDTVRSPRDNSTAWREFPVKPEKTVNSNSDPL
jgi:hypothetical protein